MPKCEHCNRPVEDDDGTWFHPDSNTARCDGPDDEPGLAWSDLVRQASPTFDVGEFLVRFECDEDITTDEVIEGFQYLVTTGLAWSLQGTYGRTAVALIDAGLVTAPGEA